MGPPRIGQRRSCTIVSSDGLPMSVNSDGRADIVQHGHYAESSVHFHIGSLGSNQNYILIDISNINSFFHVNTSYLHLDNMTVQIDGPANATYTLGLAFLENVTSTGADVFEVWHVDGNQIAGRSHDFFFPWFPNGPRCKSSFFTSHLVTRNSSSFQLDLNQPTTLDPSTADTPSGNGDLVLITQVTAGSITFSIDMNYHGH